MASPAFSDVIDFLRAQGQNFPFLYQGQKLMWGNGRAFGACCEPLLADNVNALRLDSYSRAAFSFTSAGAAAFIGSTADVSFFAAGKDEAGTPQGFPANYTMRGVDTNAFPGGAPVNRGHLFWIFGLATEIESVVTLSGATPPVVGIPAYLYASVTGNAGGTYYERIYRELAESVSIQFKFLNTSVAYDMGSLVDYPSMSGLAGANMISVGSHLVGAYIPLQSVLAVNARDESRKLTMTATVSRPMSVDNDVNNPAAASTVFATVKARLYGIDICDPQAAALCGVPNGPMDIATLLAAMTANPQIMASIVAAGQQGNQGNQGLAAQMEALVKAQANR